LFSNGRDVLGESRDERPPINFKGERVALGPLRRDLIPTYHRWHNDIGLSRTFSVPQPTTLDQEEASYGELSTAERVVIFTVYELPGWTAIGTAYLSDIDYRHRCAEFGVMIGEVDRRGKGLGTEATQLMLDYAFTALGLHSVMLTVYEFNLAGFRAYEKAGFRECGRRRESHWMGGRFWDEIYMDCLATEFSSPVLGGIFVPDPPRS
jgi:diamine N-acetyltransferase